MMPVSCCAYECTVPIALLGSRDTRFYRFPRDPERRRRWMLYTVDALITAPLKNNYISSWRLTNVSGANIRVALSITV